MRFFCVPSFFPRIHFQIHEAFAQLRDSDISVLQSGLLRMLCVCRLGVLSLYEPE